MILAALAVAAIVDASPAAPSRIVGAPTVEKTPNLYREPAGCRSAPYRIVDRFGRPLPQKLGDLPPGAVILAVERTIGGCQLVTVAYGAVELDRPVPPSWAYRVDPLDRSAAKRGDAPSNRR
jgi:hypothetical protein